MMVSSQPPLSGIHIKLSNCMMSMYSPERSYFTRGTGQKLPCVMQVSPYAEGGLPGRWSADILHEKKLPQRQLLLTDY